MGIERDTMGMDISMRCSEEIIGREFSNLEKSLREVLEIPSRYKLVPRYPKSSIEKLSWRKNDQFRFRPSSSYPRSFSLSEPNKFFKFGNGGRVDFELGYVDFFDSDCIWEKAGRYVVIDSKLKFFNRYFGEEFSTLNRVNILYVENEKRFSNFSYSPRSMINMDMGFAGIEGTYLSDDMQKKLHEVFYKN